jgi:hypothetical protein
VRHPDPCARVTFTSRQIKTQMQAHRGLSTPKVSTVLSNVYSGAGLRGFWSGCQPNVARCFIGNACEIGCYDEAKTRLIAAGVPDGPLGHFGASGIAGTVSAIFSTPVDVVKTRLMAQAGGVPTEGVVQYAGVVDCFMRMPAIEGVASLYKGFVPSTCMHNAEARAWTCLWLTRTPACTMLAQSRPLSHAAWRLREPSRSQSPHAKLPGRSCTSSRTSRRSRGFGVRTHEGVRIPLESDLVFLPKHSPFTPSQRRKEAIFLRSSRPIAAANAVVQRRLFARDRAGSHVTGPVCLSGTPGLSGPARIPWTNGLRIASSGALTPQGGRGGERPPAPCPSYGRAAPPAVGT